MAKNKVSEWSATPANNTDIANIDIAEGCAPSGINNAIREIMAQVKDMQTGADGDTFTVGGNFTANASTILGGELVSNGTSGTAGQVLLSRGTGLSPQWGVSFVSGMIMLWSGSVATIPTGWFLCDGLNSTPDLRNRFVIGAAGDLSGVAATTITGTGTISGGSKDAIVVSHTHSATVTDPGHLHGGVFQPSGSSLGDSRQINYASMDGVTNTATTGISVTNSTTGSSGTNANLPPYYALAYIMKS
jgi:hypothetical protein